MERCFRILASIKLAVLLLVLLLIGLAFGTIVESRTSTEIAGWLVYYSWWFIGLQVLLVVNVAMSLVNILPWTKGRIGFVITHASIVLIMLGAMVTFFFKTEGKLFLWEGESSSIIYMQDGNGNIKSMRDLPFTVKLDDFVLDTYPGTNRPSGFASYVQITDKQDNHSFTAKIWMNNPLKFRGYSLFQSSYQIDHETGREASVLTVSKDPGQTIVFAGYISILLGMVWMLVCRARLAKAVVAVVILFLLVAPYLSSQGVEQTQLSSADISRLERLPVQYDGRAMPLDTFAREMVIKITGSTKWQGRAPILTLLQWIDNVETTVIEGNIKIDSADFAMAIGYPATTKHASFMALIHNQAFIQHLNIYNQCFAHGVPVTKNVATAVELEKRLDLMKGIVFGVNILPIPVSGDFSATWHGLEVVSSQSLLRLMDGQRIDGWPAEGKINNEVFYNKLNPVRLSWIIMFCSLIISIFAWLKKNKWMDIVAFLILACGFAMMTWGVILRWQAGERIPAANMYESMLFLAWGVGLFAVVAYGLLRRRLVVINTAILATLTMFLADVLPMDHFIHPIAPVLAGTPWLAIHVPIIMVGYAVLALGMVVAHIQIGAWIFTPNHSNLTDRFYDMLYWYNFIGSICLLAGILTGSMWAAFSWGRYWGWDPKEVWSLVAFLAYMAIMHAMAGGMIGKLGVAMMSILAFQTVLMTYLGVNFVLSIGMHSYGMGDSPIAIWMFTVAIAELMFLGFGLMAYLKQKH
ncbi:MAG: cytochrome c biogenesis protein CcsA [Holophagaceae bacterium]|nr:cytochrome c biogenesis protein CcsA [Holophagaceae bacterium]